MSYKAVCNWATAIIAIANSFFGAFVLTRLWAWFVVPLGVPAIGMAHAMGLVLMLALMMMHLKVHEDTDHETGLYRTIARSLAIALAWGLGAIIAGFMS